MNQSLTLNKKIAEKRVY